jgi:hypothetical protein
LGFAAWHDRDKDFETPDTKTGWLDCPNFGVEASEISATFFVARAGKKKRCVRQILQLPFSNCERMLDVFKELFSCQVHHQLCKRRSLH